MFCLGKIPAAIQFQGGKLHLFQHWNQTQIITHSTSQHSTTWWSDGKLVKQQGFWKVEFRAQCRILCFP